MLISPVPRSANKLGSLIEVCEPRKNGREDFGTWLIAAIGKTLEVEFAMFAADGESIERFTIRDFANRGRKIECARADVTNKRLRRKKPSSTAAAPRRIPVRLRPTRTGLR
jgi:hypothetical protein